MLQIALRRPAMWPMRPIRQHYRRGLLGRRCWWFIIFFRRLVGPVKQSYERHLGVVAGEMYLPICCRQFWDHTLSGIQWDAFSNCNSCFVVGYFLFLGLTAGGVCQSIAVVNFEIIQCLGWCCCFTFAWSILTMYYSDYRIALISFPPHCLNHLHVSCTQL